MIEGVVFVIRLAIKASFYAFIFTALFAITTILISGLLSLGMNNSFMFDVIRIIDAVCPFHFIAFLSWLIVLASSIFTYRVGLYVKSHVDHFLA